MHQPYIFYRFDVQSPIQFRKTGKCEAVSSVQIHSPHNEEAYELIIETEGTVCLQFMNSRCCAVPGEYLLLHPSLPRQRMTPGSVKNLQESKCSFYWMRFSCSSPALFSRTLAESSRQKAGTIPLPIHGALIHPQKALLLMRQLQDCVRSGYDACYLNYMATLIICEISNQHRFFLSRGENGAANTKKQLYNDIIDYVNYFINDDLKVTSIARHFGYNDKYLSRYFKKMSGVSLKHYILSQKIERANFLLTDTNLTVSDISNSLGFSDYHNFIRVYKSMTSMTPSEYRNLYSQRILEHH